jgi:hypothetical protein
MKITVTEIREAKFIEIPGMPRKCIIGFAYEVSTDECDIRTFRTKDSVEEYIKYLEEQKHDYKKVIKEIEI